jgi:hypothetical protein
LELPVKEIWTGAGVQDPEFFEPEPYIELMEMNFECKGRQDVDKMLVID